MGFYNFIALRHYFDRVRIGFYTVSLCTFDEQIIPKRSPRTVVIYNQVKDFIFIHRYYIVLHIILHNDVERLRTMYIILYSARNI